MHFSKVYQKFMDLKIQYKICFSTMALLVFLIFFIYVTSVVFLQKVISSDSLQRIAYSQESCKESLQSNYNKYMFQFNKLVSASSFQQTLFSIHNQNRTVAEHQLLLQDAISTLIAANPLVEMVYFVDEYRNTYQSYGTYCKDETDLLFFQSEQISGITIFPEQKSPYVTSDNVIPIVIPLTLRQVDDKRFTMITDSPNDTTLFVTLLVNSVSLNDSLHFWYNDFNSSSLFLIDSTGTLLSIPTTNNSHIDDYLNEIQTNSYLTNLFESDTAKQYKISNAYVTSTVLTPNLALINITANDALFSILSALKQYMILVLITGLLITALMTFLISLYVSGPIARLAEIVHKIKTNTYNEIIPPHSSDEVGELNGAINDMYLTIKEQIQQIKLSERQKYQAEVNLLAEQINPHLLYNTLEFINMEIYNHNTEIASNMIQALANYMRISLSYGNEKILLQDELMQVRAYLNMMNYRFHNNIVLLTSISVELKDGYIAKTILQPFVENSIKHGFAMENDASLIFSPTIEIVFKLVENRLYIEISDNGVGFNEHEVYAILRDNTKQHTKRHVGIRNVMQRLEACYPDVTIILSSIPYYKNKIIIHFPYQLEAKITEVTYE